jgi:hypothetical protein
MSSLKLVHSVDRPKIKTPHGSKFDITKRAVIEDGIPTIRFWKNGKPFLTIKEEDMVIAKFEKVLRDHWNDMPEPEITHGPARKKLESLLV